MMPCGISPSWATSKGSLVRLWGSLVVLIGAPGPAIVCRISTRSCVSGCTSSRRIIAGGDTGAPGETLLLTDMWCAGKPSGGSGAKKAYASCLGRSASVWLRLLNVMFLPGSTRAMCGLWISSLIQPGMARRSRSATLSMNTLASTWPSRSIRKSTRAP